MVKHKSSEAHTATEIDRANPPTQIVPAGPMPMEEEIVGEVSMDAPVWEGGDPGDGIPQNPSAPEVDQTYWHEGEADQVSPSRTPSPAPSPPEPEPLV